MLAAMTIPIRPHRLAEAASRTGDLWAAILGAAGAATGLALPLGVVSASVNGPYDSAGRYFESVLTALIAWWWVLFVLGLVLCLAIMRGFPVRAGVETRICVLSPLTILLPMAIWSPFLVCTPGPEAFYVATAAPEWMHWPALQLAGSCFWFLLFISAWCIFLVHGLNKAHTLRPPQVCERCHYDLRGLPPDGNVCPECGALFDRNELLLNGAPPDPAIR